MTGEGLMSYDSHSQKCEHPRQKLSKYGHGRVGSTTVGLQHTRGTHIRGGLFVGGLSIAVLFNNPQTFDKSLTENLANSSSKVMFNGI